MAIALGCLCIIGIVAAANIMRLRDDAAWVAHSWEVVSTLDSLLAMVNEQAASQRGFVITGDESFVRTHSRSVARATRDLQELRSLTSDNPEQTRRIAALEPVLAARVARSNALIELRRTRGFEQAQRLALDGEGRRLIDDIRRRIGEMTAYENSVLVEREQRAQHSATLARAVIAGGALLALAVGGLALIALRRDFAGRHRAEAELERFFSLSLDFLCIASAAGYFKRVSPAVTDILGWSVKEFLSRPFLDFVHPDDHAATLREVHKQVVAGQKVLHFENRYRHKDGSWRVLAWRSMPQPDGLMYATARDVTELRESERLLEQRVRERTEELAKANHSLRDRERRFRALIEHGSDGITLIAPDNRILYVSPTVTRVEGYEPEELLGRYGTEHTHPDDLPLVQQIVAHLMANPGVPVPVLWRRRHKNGEWLWLEGTATNLLGDPAIGGIVTNYHDVTQRQANEAKLQSQLAQLALLSQITRAIGERQDVPSIFQVAINTVEEQLPVDFAFIGLHDAVEHTVTVSSVGQHSQERAMELALTPKQRVVIDQNGLSVCVSGRLVYEHDIGSVPSPFAQRLARTGLRSMVAAPLLVESKVFGVMVAARTAPNAFSSSECEFLRQLSEHVALAAHQAQLYGDLQGAYDELRQTQQAVMQQERLLALGQMASGIAHDINNAISPVTLYTESLLETEPNLSSRARSYLETIQRAIDDVAHTVARMREFYRQRESELTLAPVDLNGLVPQVIEMTRARWSDMAQLRGVAVTMRTELAPDLPEVLGIESELREALVNLIFNAVDAMQKDGPLTVRTRTAQIGRPDWGSTSPDDSVVLEVVDCGVGMDDDTRRRCLEPFFTTKGERGTGLGLAMVYGSMQRHGAKIEIDSAPSEGTAVRLCFAIPADAAASVLKARVAAPTAPSPRRILLIDDDPLVLKSLRDTLEVDGHSVSVANGGQAGIDLFMESHTKGEPFEVVITDLGMPYVDGRKVSASIKQARPATRVIMLTGWGQRMLAEGSTPDHVDRVLGKPPKLRELREALGGLEPAGAQELRA
jgi:PAS domain S-box-containing protein